MGNGNGRWSISTGAPPTDLYATMRNGSKCETPNDLIIYGSKMYCAMSRRNYRWWYGSSYQSYYQVKPSKEIEITRESTSQQPRHFPSGQGNHHSTRER
ncbi:hypothetical protein MASR1M31_07780 [Porphyromonadaceae bacterium]